MIYVSGDPAIAIAGEGARPADIEAIRKFYGFDRPILEQYLTWLFGALQGDFGRSYTLRQPVADVIFARLPVTITLGALAIAFALVLAIPLGEHSLQERRNLALPLDREHPEILSLFNGDRKHQPLAVGREAVGPVPVRTICQPLNRSRAISPLPIQVQRTSCAQRCPYDPFPVWSPNRKGVELLMRRQRGQGLPPDIPYPDIAPLDAIADVERQPRAIR
jgi:hypothetical protein